jgi:hypothetical protein
VDVLKRFANVGPALGKSALRRDLRFARRDAASGGLFLRSSASYPTVVLGNLNLSEIIRFAEALS